MENPEIDFQIDTTKNGLQLLLIAAKESLNKLPLEKQLHGDNGKDLNNIILQLNDTLEELEPRESAF